MEPRAPKKEVYILQQLSNHESIFWMLIQRHLDLRGWKTEALSVQSTLGGSIREPSIRLRKSLHAVPPLPTQHAGGLSSTLSLAVEPSRAYSSPRRMIVLHLCSISLTASPTADSAVRGRPCPNRVPIPGSPDRSSTGVLQTPCESPRQVCDKVSPTKERAFR
jgi:hypothetical protein